MQGFMSKIIKTTHITVTRNKKKVIIEELFLIQTSFFLLKFCFVQKMDQKIENVGTGWKRLKDLKEHTLVKINIDSLKFKLSNLN